VHQVGRKRLSLYQDAGQQNVKENEHWYLFTDVLGQPIGPIFRGQAAQVWRLKTAANLRRLTTQKSEYFQYQLLHGVGWWCQFRNAHLILVMAHYVKVKVDKAFFFSHSYRTSCHYQSFIYSPTDALVSCLKKTILKFTLKFILKQLRHVSMLQLHHHQGAY